MKNRLSALGAAALLFLPAALNAQGFGVAARGGTLGLGAEAALGLTPKFAIRGGVGLMPLETDATRFWDVGDDVTATLELPKTWYNIGADLYLGGGFRIGGGMLFKPDDPTLTASLTATGSIEIDGTTYTGTEVAEVVGSFDSKDSAPYALIGFGRHTASGIGLFLDLGLAFLGDPAIKLEATKGDLSNPSSPGYAEFQARLAEEEQNLDEDLPTWAKKYWPILNIGIKFGVGR